MKKNKNHNPAPAFEPRPGLKFKLNDRRLNRVVILIKPIEGGRRWKVKSISNRGSFSIPAARLHAGPYADGWSLFTPADALLETFETIEVKGNF